MLRLAGAALMAALLAVPALAAQTIKIGVTPGTHEQVMEVVRDIAREKGLDLEIVTFSDYILPNQALASGDLDANSFQHGPYLNQQIQDRGYDLVAVARNFIEPMGVYSRKHKKLEDLPQGAQVAIPNDPSNGGRALLLLQQKGIIEVDPARGLTPGILDITGNPKQLAFVEIDAAQLPRALQDVDAAAINTNYALEAGLNPLKDAIAIESPESPYANLIVVRREDENKPWVRTLIGSYQNDAVRKFIADTFKGAVVPAF